MLSIVLQNQIQQSRYIKIRGICFRYINPRTYGGGGGGGGRGGGGGGGGGGRGGGGGGGGGDWEEVDATRHLGFSEFFLEDQASTTDVLSSCLFIPGSHFQTNLVMIS